MKFQHSAYFNEKGWMEAVSIRLGGFWGAFFGARSYLMFALGASCCFQFLGLNGGFLETARMNLCMVFSWVHLRVPSPAHSAMFPAGNSRPYSGVIRALCQRKLGIGGWVPLDSSDGRSFVWLLV